MLSKSQKISREEFPKGFKNGNTYNSQNISLFVSKGVGVAPSKFSFVVSLKVSKNAVKRNLLKRRGYYIVGKNNTQIKTGFICVLFFKKGSIGVSYKKIENEVLFLFKKANII